MHKLPDKKQKFLLHFSIKTSKFWYSWEWIKKGEKGKTIKISYNDFIIRLDAVY